jgi:hypothetical protein
VLDESFILDSNPQATVSAMYGSADILVDDFATLPKINRQPRMAGTFISIAIDRN